MDSSAAPPYDDEDNHINSEPETSWPSLANEILSSHGDLYQRKPSTNGLILSLTSFQKRQAEASCVNLMCRMVRGRQRVNANAGARALPFGKRSDVDDDEERNALKEGFRSVRGRRRGRRPRARGAATHPSPQNKLPFGKRFHL